MTKITPKLLIAIAGVRPNTKVVRGLVEHLPEVMQKYGITTRLRMAHFLAQLAHESDHFKTLEEYASGAAYEGRKSLGNVKRGDGRRFKGRGAIQLTGRANYTEMSKKLGVDLVNNPELAATARISALTAAEYWTSRGLNKFADKDDVMTITKRINGGYNGLKSRIAFLHRAKKVIKDNLEVDVPQKPNPPVVSNDKVAVSTANANVVPINIAAFDTSGINLTEEEKQRILKELLDPKII